jgi:ABC-type polysaccharide/polyol phosphate transport system ATPase subunit
MQARLCFAIAMLFPASIYCFDEVLAVVDGEFRERCLGEVRTLARSGATVFFISHDLQQVPALCDRVMWLEQGRVREIGDADEVVEHYRRYLVENAAA